VFLRVARTSNIVWIEVSQQWRLFHPVHQCIRHLARLAEDDSLRVFILGVKRQNYFLQSLQFRVFTCQRTTEFVQMRLHTYKRNIVSIIISIIVSSNIVCRAS